MAKKKCAHSYGSDGRCSKCGARKPGRPKNSARKPARSIPAAAAAPANAPAPVAASSTPAATGALEARRARFDRLFAPAAPEPEPEPEEETEDLEEREEPAKPEATDEKKPIRIRLNKGWPWLGERFADGCDIAATVVIDRLSKREPLDAGEDEHKELAEATAEYGRQRFGETELPPWAVFLICFLALLWSKWAGAPKKTELAKLAPKPQQPPAPEQIPTDADSADMSTRESVAGVTMPETNGPAPSKTEPAGGSASFALFG